MSDPLHALGCPCFPCHTQRNPRALAPAMGPVVLAPEPLYPRGPDNTSDSTDAELDGLRARVAELEGRAEKALPHLTDTCECSAEEVGYGACTDRAADILRGDA